MKQMKGAALFLIKIHLFFYLPTCKEIFSRLALELSHLLTAPNSSSAQRANTKKS